MTGKHSCKEVAETGRAGKLRFKENGGVPDQRDVRFARGGAGVADQRMTLFHGGEGYAEAGIRIDTATKGHERFTGPAGIVFRPEQACDLPDPDIKTPFIALCPTVQEGRGGQTDAQGKQQGNQQKQKP